MLIKYHSDKIEQPNKYVLIIVNITNQLYGLFQRKRERSERREKGNGSVSRWSFLPEREGILLFLYSFGTSVWGSLSNEICLCFFRFLVVVFLGVCFQVCVVTRRRFCRFGVVLWEWALLLLLGRSMHGVGGAISGE